MSSSSPNPVMLSVISELLPDLHAKAGCKEIGLTHQSFAMILAEVGAKHAAGLSQTEVRNFFLSLRVDELALARACAAGHEMAWELFLTRYREKLYLSALRIVRVDSAAHDLADTLYADLYGTTKRLVSLDEEFEEGVQFRAPEPEPLPLADNRLSQATDQALATLPAE